ncbi:YbhB/YbcL family Raf kinase inhibitor-like protein [Puniceicoccaceae bacterium K14]|nr:YbhB/YbcL family Raf kinase inhibitor-like protein [Puniceicoccaceae bacterium K14]
MQPTLSLSIDGWNQGDPIPARFAFGKPGTDGPFAVSDNINPSIRWENTPSGTRSFALICHDIDVPSSGEDVNQEGRVVSADLPRVPFYHWVLVDIPASLNAIDEGVASNGVTARGKPCGKSSFGVNGQNSYTDWFAGDPDMEGIYGSYDGPCPPWNDSIVHRYYFTLYALDVDTLSLPESATGPETLEAMSGHILAEASYMGTYSMNPDMPA